MRSRLEVCDCANNMSTSSIPDYWRLAKHDLSSDLVLSRLFEEYDDTVLTSDGNLFRTLIVSIVGQQISTVAASAVRGRVERLVGEIEPGRILTHSHEELRSCGLSSMKAEYIIGLALAWTEGYENIEWQRLTDEEAISKLTALRGVGTWTAEMVLIFALLRPDVLPLKDIGLIRAIEKQYNQGSGLSTDQIEEISQHWAPWRTVATWYLWRSIDPEPVQY